jgi:drug/metabolite transporter (DMT)-like permease
VTYPTRLVVIAFASVYLIWGSTYLAILFAIETMPTFLMIGARFVIGGGVLYMVSRKLGADKPTPANWKSAIISGLLLMGCGTGTVAWAEHRIPSGLAALLVSTLPIWMVSIDVMSGRAKRASRLVVAGITVGFMGVGLIVWPAGGLGASVDLAASVAVILASLMWALGSIYTRYANLPKSAYLSASMQMLCGGMALILLGLILGEAQWLELGAISTKSWLAFIYLIVFGNLAFLAFAWLLRASTPAKVSTYAYVNPIVAVILGWILAGERLSAQTLMGAALIIGSVVTIVSFKPRS